MKCIKLLVISALLFFISEAPGVHASMPAEGEASDSLVSVNFQNTDIKQAIKVLGDITGKVIIPNDELSGTITVISLEKVPSDVVVSVLESALMVRGFTLVKSGDVLKIVPLPDTKQTNVAVRIGSSPESVKDEDIVITQVINLEYSSSLQLKTGLQPLVGKHGNIIANERSNTLIITDTSSNIKRLMTIISEIEKPMASKKQVKAFILNYGSAETIASILKDLSQEEEKGEQFPQSIQLPQDNSPLQMFGAIEALPDITTNSLVVSSAPVNFPSIERLIKNLDIFPPQAMIEAVIMDVTLDDDIDMGIEYSHPTSSTSTTEGLEADLFGMKDRESTFHSLLGLATSAATRGFTYRIFNEKETLNILTFILQTQEHSKVLSTPKILASNNQESVITVGQEVPIIESSVTDVVNNITTVNFKYEDIGLSLQVTPRISQDDYVNLKVHAEIKELSPQTIFNANIINKREADATVLIPHRHTVVLGGLIRDNNSVIENKIPLLGDIPFLGNLFKRTETTVRRTELLIFLTPHILKDNEDLKAITTNPIQMLNIIKKAESTKELKEAVKEVTDYPRKELKAQDRQVKPTTDGPEEEAKGKTDKKSQFLTAP
ncbi:MAG: hypothetical protein JW867_04200 [Candidatus Omnitrophica bacterium]|nr:hypothetical protein [Candidatus Omnitrophota bacterium]